jgi:predicted nucleic acid-binding protein
MLENDSCFVDSNIWLYAFIEGDPEKKDIAQSLIKNAKPVISSQVINEICVNLIRQAKLPEAQISELIETFYQKYDVVELHKDLLLVASQLRQDYAFSYWDSLIVAAAFASGAKILYSEDMQHGLIIHENLEIRNPFKA